jgi:cell division septum initiation protein DivIVA
VTDQFDDFDEILREPPRPADAESILRQLIDIVSMAKPMPLSASVLISRDEVLDLLEDALAQLPEELRQARWLLRERDDFRAEQEREAARLMEEVKAQAERMVSRTELVRQAKTTADQIIEEAEETARRMRHEAEDYCDQKLAGMEIVLNRVLKTVTAGRERLQPQLEEVAEADLEESIEEGDDVFFDQDQL